MAQTATPDHGYVTTDNVTLHKFKIGGDGTLCGIPRTELQEPLMGGTSHYIEIGDEDDIGVHSLFAYDQCPACFARHPNLLALIEDTRADFWKEAELRTAYLLGVESVEQAAQSIVDHFGKCTNPEHEISLSNGGLLMPKVAPLVMAMAHLSDFQECIGDLIANDRIDKAKVIIIGEMGYLAGDS